MDPLHKACPKIKGMLRHSGKGPKTTEFEMFKMPKSSGQSQGVVIAIEETTPSEFVLSAPPKAHLPKIQTSGTALNPNSSREAIEVLAAADHEGRTNRLPPPPPLVGTKSSAEQRSPSPSHTNSSKTIRNDSVASTSPQSPVMRSMFPRYDPKIPLAKQHYYPSIQSLRGSVKEQTSASTASRVKILNSTLSKTGIGSRGSASQTLESRLAPTLSTPEELLDLWSVANGQGSQEAADTYTLGLSCPELTLNHEIISFTSSQSQSLYTLEVDKNNLKISRSHPINSTTTIYISSPTISDLTPNNPLITTIFPNLAELMALDQSSSIAVDHRLDRQGSADLQAEALDRAHRQEASTLFWDTDSEKYYLIHPTLSSDNNGPATFRIESSLRDGIDIFAPDPTTPTSTLTPIPMLHLSFTSLSLTIHTLSLTQLPSLYILDTLLTALLTLLLHLHRTCPSPSPLTLATPPYPPPPPQQQQSLPPSSSSPNPSFPPPQSILSRLRAKLPNPFRTSAPLDEESGPLHPPPSRLPASASPSKASRSLFSLSQPIATATAKTTKSKTSSFLFIPSAATTDASVKLPRPTRALLRILGWAFRLLVWALGIGIGIVLGIAGWVLERA